MNNKPALTLNFRAQKLVVLLHSHDAQEEVD
jgi:hypothetical protein